MAESYDVIVIGAGSVGIPAAMALAGKRLSTLVLEPCPSTGQGNNKKAIGGIRATHSDFAKIRICLRSIEIFANWEELHGRHIGWLRNGYSYPAYTVEDEKKLKELMEIQHSHGLDIRWVSPGEYNELVPGINMDGLRGATYSPGDGSASPLMAVNAFYFKSLECGARYRFNEKVTAIHSRNGNGFEVITDKGAYSSATVVNAAGNEGAEIASLVGQEYLIRPDCHEAAISEPVRRFFGPMVVDMRPSMDSKNYYFYQNFEGQVVFCITPDPAIYGADSDSTSEFFPMVAKRMVSLYPRLANLKVRRAWRGQYPNTPDGFPIVGSSRELPGFIHAIGMCGQGFMLGPGLGELIARMVAGEVDDDDRRILKSFDPYRDFSGMEALK
ncbi:MAG: FAD-binding oxidoreductase [Acidobacteriia bacterium]|nr:FAD-binding oxidoreductase [Terriglobia bacterium]